MRFSPSTLVTCAVALAESSSNLSWRQERLTAARPSEAASSPKNAFRVYDYNDSGTPQLAIPVVKGDFANNWLAAAADQPQDKAATPLVPATPTPNQPTDTSAVQLRNILLSHGFLQPPMDPSIYKYKVVLDQPVDQIAIVPEIDRTRPEYRGEAGAKALPIITVNWKGQTNKESESSALAVKKQIDLPDDGSDLTISIKVQSPVDQTYSIYKVQVKQSFPSPAMLKVIEGSDETGNAVLVQPVANQEDSLYHVFVSPEAGKVSLKLGCNTGSALKVNGKSMVNGSVASLKRDLERHSQVVEVTCSKDIKFPGVPIIRKFAILLISDWPLASLTPPKLIVDDVGRECQFSEDDQSYRCPDPKTDSHKTRLISPNEPSIRYVLTSNNRQVEVRLLDRQPTIPFTYSSALTLTATAGQFKKSWPVSFNGTALPSLLQIFGWVLALALAILLFALVCVIGAANVFGLGVPLGATEIAATLTLIIQYLCFANFMRGSTLLNEMIAPLKWVTLFWPLPWSVGDSLKRRKLLAVSDFSSAYGLELWGESSLGDVTDIRNACGCLFWACMAINFCLIFHSFIYIKFRVIEKEYTFPHRMRWGNWESRTLHWLAFPTAAAAAMILASDITTVAWKVVAGSVLGAYLVWVSVIYLQVQTSVTDVKVCWIWNSSVREDGSLEDESGYWMDIVADQLQTQPVNRSLCKGLFPYRWISTVGDCVPVTLSQALFTGGATEVFPPAKFARAHKEAAYPLAKNPQIVEVVKTRAPGGPCKGQRLIAGLLRTQWLDILFTYQGLTRFHSQVFAESGNFTAPLIVKTSQLSGPIASGSNAFFYDGARIPFIRIGDFLYRLSIGAFVGVALASEGYKVDAAMFSLVALLSGCLMSYVATTKPYSRGVENWLVVGMLATIAFSACSFVYYAINKQDPSWIADIFLWLVAVCCFLLAAYSCVVTFSVFSALFCPPLEESRFLEKLANCNVTVSDEQSGWAFDLPAFSKFPVRDLKAHCTLTGAKRIHVTIYGSGEEPTLEFSSTELKAACRSGYLVPPVVVVFAPAPESPLGYRHFAVANKDEVQKNVAAFLGTDHATRHLADEVARHVTHQVEVKGRGKTILSITIIPPQGVDFAAVPTSRSRSSTIGGSSLERRSKASKRPQQR